MKKILVMLILGCVLLNAAEYKTIGWEDLQGKVEAYDDPFKQLTEEQIYNISIYARISKMDKVTPKRVSEGMRKEVKKAEETLKKEGVNIAYLLSQREHIKEMRKKTASAVNLDLNNTNISMSGFMLALDLKEGKTNEFLLVPTVGACIHTPPPPMNQIVYVTINKAVKAGLRFEAVTISGKIISKNMSSNLFLVDGKSDINSGYTMQADKVVKFKRK